MPALPAFSFAYLQFTKQQTVIRHWTTAAASNAVPGGTQNDLISIECSVLADHGSMMPRLKCILLQCLDVRTCEMPLESQL